MEISGANGIFVGGASGMCRATAEQFVEKGGNVIILDLEKSNGAEVASELGASFLPCIQSKKLDMMAKASSMPAFPLRTD